MQVWAKKGDRIHLAFAASFAPARFEALVYVLPPGRDKDPEELSIPTPETIATDRSVTDIEGEAKVTRAGFVVAATITGSFVGVKRGQFYAFLFLQRGSSQQRPLCAGYVYQNHPVALGEFKEPVEGLGFHGSNEADITLVNNTLVSRVLICPTGARWRLEGGSMNNADNVERAATVLVDDGTAGHNHTRYHNSSAIAAGVDLVYPAHTTGQDRESFRESVMMSEGDRITFTWAAGGASAGGTARSSANVEEWIYT